MYSVSSGQTSIVQIQTYPFTQASERVSKQVRRLSIENGNDKTKRKYEPREREREIERKEQKKR